MFFKNIKNFFMINFVLVFIIFFYLGQNSVFSADVDLDFKKQQMVTELVQEAINYYYDGGDTKKAEHEIFKGITITGKMDALEKIFLRLTEIAPYRLDFYFATASSELRQNKVEKALKMYEKVLGLDPTNFNAKIQLLAYNKILEKISKEDYLIGIKTLEKKHKENYKKYQSFLDKVETVYTLRLNTLPPEGFEGEDTAIVVLGYTLAPDGTMQEALLERLKTAYNLANHYTEAQVIVSGGGTLQGGVTEAFRMKEWLVDNGIDKRRVFMDTTSRDTVENAWNSLAIIYRLKSKKVIVVSSASHIRRVVAVFVSMADAFGMELKIGNMVSLDYPTIKDAEAVSDVEKILILQDAFRASGIWAYPGMQI